MDKIRLGRTNMMVSRVGFGGIPIQRLSDEDAIAVVNRCINLGVNFLDTANGYTTSEGRIGRAIAGRRKDLFIATKSLGRTRDEAASHLSLSLKRLAVDHIDLYQFHNISDSPTLEAVLAPGGPMSVIEEAKKAGVVRHIGVTSHQMDSAMKAVATGRFETVMFPFNCLNPEVAEGLLPLARRHDVGFIAMKPLAGGAIQDGKIALKYILQFPDVLPIPGIEKIAEIEEIARVAEGPKELSPKDREAVERLRKELGDRFCHRCDYCQPCKEGIPISNIMWFPSLVRRLPSTRVFSGRFADDMEKAARCTQCGECESRCPYDLPIRDRIAEYTQQYKAERERFEGRAA